MIKRDLREKSKLGLIEEIKSEGITIKRSDAKDAQNKELLQEERAKKKEKH